MGYSDIPIPLETSLIIVGIASLMLLIGYFLFYYYLSYRSRKSEAKPPRGLMLTFAYRVFNILGKYILQSASSYRSCAALVPVTVDKVQPP